MKIRNDESLETVRERERERERESYTLLKNKNSSDNKCQDNICKKMGIKPEKNQAFVAVLFAFKHLISY